MSASVLAFAPRPEGRPSYASLQLEVRTLRNAVATLTEERDDLDVELQAQVSERIAAASETLALARRAMVAVAAGYRPTQQLVAIERLALREQLRARVTPDGAA